MPSEKVFRPGWAIAARATSPVRPTIVSDTRATASTAASISTGPFLSRAARPWRSRPDSRRHEMPSTTHGTTRWDPQCSATSSPVLGAAASTTSRTVQFSDVLSQPVFSDTVSAGDLGLAESTDSGSGRRRRIRGDVGFSSGGNAFWNYYATAELRLGLEPVRRPSISAIRTIDIGIRTAWCCRQASPTSPSGKASWRT